MKKVLGQEKEILDISLINKGDVLNVPAFSNSYLLIKDIKEDVELDFEVEEGATLRVNFLAEKVLKNFKMLANLGKNSKIIVFFADFSVEENKTEVTINLNAEGASAEWHLASLSAHTDKKNISVSVYHRAPSTFAKVDNYGVAKEDSKLVFSGTSHILNGSVKSDTQQNAKIMVFDNNSDAVAKPILKIDENDIMASHAAAVGKISDEHLFYLTSRGLSEDEAKNLITLGYLKPILRGFDEEEIAYMNELIGGRI